MPELPEVEVYKRYIEETSLNQEISGAALYRESVLLNTSKAALIRKLKGSRLQRVMRHGKFLFVQLSKGGYLLMHFGLTGDLKYVDEGDEQPRFTVLFMEFKKGGGLAFLDMRLIGRLDIVEDANKYIANKGYGPDAMEISREESPRSSPGGR